jgi:four helix bundle protein
MEAPGDSGRMGAIPFTFTIPIPIPNPCQVAMPESRFDRLDVYRLSIAYAGLTYEVIQELRRRETSLGDQLMRATSSVPLNIAEGAAEFSPGDKVRFYRYALRSCAESVAILDVAREIGQIDAMKHSTCREPAIRIISMLTRMVAVVRDRDGDRIRKRRREDPEST